MDKNDILLSTNHFLNIYRKLKLFKYYENRYVQNISDYLLYI